MVIDWPAITKLVERRLRVCRFAPICPKCRTKQVQAISFRPLASWKCRKCKHSFRFEPVIQVS